MATTNRKGTNNNLPEKPGKNKPEAKGSKGAVSNSIILDANNPLPIEFNGNLFVSLKGKKYVPFLHPNDLFGQFLTEAKFLSPTTLSCVSSKAEYCLGAGVYFEGIDKDLAYQEWSAHVNRKHDSLNDIIKGAFDHKFTIGNSFIQVVRGKIGNKKFVRVYLRNYLDCRLASPDDDDICNTVFISKYFRKLGIWNVNMMKTEEIPIYSPNMFDNTWAEDEKGNQHTIFHLKNEASGYDYYGLPSNIGSLPQQILEYKASRYNLDNFENNLIIGGVIVVKGQMSNEEAKKTGRQIIHQHTGDGKQGRWIILSSETGMSDGIEVHPFDKQKEGSFIESDTHNEEKIYVANKWNKLLIGGSEKKGIGQGNSAYIRSVFDIANNTLIMPEQKFMIDKFIKPLMQICDDWMGTQWSKKDISLKGIQPVSFLGDIDLNAIITKDEGRDIIGKGPMEDPAVGNAFIKTGPAPSTNDSNPNINVQD